MNSEPGEADEREERLDAAVAEYLEAAERGQEPDRAEFLARYPDLADELSAFFDDREQFRQLVDPFVGGADADGSPCPRCRGSLETAAGGTTCGSCGWRVGSAPAADPFPVPYRLGRIELFRVIGRGGFATVYLGWDARLRRRVAVKVFRTTPLTTDEDRKRFCQDPVIAAQLSHPGIVKVYGADVAGGVPYLVSEFVPGQTLAALIRTDRPAPSRAAELVAAVAGALQHAHDKGVVHRDVKPANVILAEDGAPLLTDFGLARWDASDATTNATLTGDEKILGTLAYMSPEQARGQSHWADCRSDVYSLGVVLYELLTGERPFSGSVRGVLRQIEFDEPRAPRYLDDSIPVDLETICLKCLSKEPDRRYATAAELAADLQAFLAEKPIRALPIGRIERLILWQRRNRGLALAAATAAALLLSTTAVAVGWAIHSNQQSDAIKTALHEQKRLRAERELDRGLHEADRGEVDAGLLWMARALETVPVGEKGLEWTVRANLRAWDLWDRQSFALAHVRSVPPGKLLGISPDGAAGWVCEPKSPVVRRWDLDAGRECSPTLTHPAPVSALALSPDATCVATVCSELKVGGVVRLWEVATGRTVQTLTPGGTVSSVTFTRDGRRLITAVLKPGGATHFRIWEVATGAPVEPAFQHSDWAHAIAASPDGRALYTLTRQGKTVHRVPIGGGTAEVVLSSPVALAALAVGAEGRYLLTGGIDRVARLHDLNSNRSVIIGRHSAPISVVALAPDGRRFTTAGSGDAARTWDGGRFSAPLERHPASVRAIAIGPDGQVATGCDDREVRVWKLRDGQLGLLGTLLKHDSPLAAVTYSPDGARLATSVHQHNEAALWDTTTLARSAALRHPHQVSHIAFSPDGARVATIGFDHTVRIFAAKTGELLAGPFGTGEVAFAVAFDPSGQTLLTGSADGAVRRWDANTGEPRGEPLWHAPGAIFAVAASPDGRLVLSGGEDGTARLWTTDGRPHARPVRHAGPVRAVAFGPTGRWAVTTGDDGTVRCWSVDTGQAIGPVLSHDGPVFCAAVAPRDPWLLTGGFDRTVRVWPAPSAAADASDRLTLWAQVRTGTELDETGAVQVLTPDVWRERRNRLQE
ncbi:protein kinase [Gemmata sp. JC673]|uniref:Protein kinase n=1 Tax=Gemmata algarum TaxID=2975278 RepID=A0ABU5F2K0_9BACT|nr:protein kinase [Gemmata algarum]MDY3561790.1 protein kinase [Gemmata algarum]